LRVYGAVVSTAHIPKLKYVPTKRLIALGVGITVAYSAICAGFLWDTARRDYENALVSATNLTKSIQSEIARNIELYDLSLQAVADGLQLPGFDRIDPALRQIILFDRAASARDLGSILVLNEQGDLTVESRTLSPRTQNYAGREYFQFYKNNASAGHYISGPFVTKKGEYILAITRRLNKPDGSFQGVVVGNMKLSYFHRLFNNMKLGPHDSLTLLRSNGVILMRSPFDIDTIGHSFGKSSFSEHILASQSGSVDAKSKLDGMDRLFVYHQVDNDPLHIVAGLAHETIYAEWRREVWVIGSLNLALCVVTMSLIVFLANALKRRTIAEHDRAIMATTDGLTSICNRQRFDELLENEWRRSQRTQTPIALIMIDADNFKAFNDKHGHQAGDAALASLAQCIAGGAMRAADLAARYGGEEFAVLLPGESVEGALIVAEKIRATVLTLRDQQQGRSDMSPTISVGVASMIPQAGLSSRDLVKSADAALYKAKQQGRNCCVTAAAVRLVHNANLAA